MAFSKGYNSDSLEKTRKYISDASVAAKYLGITKIPCLIASPLRKDSKPSFGLYSKDGIKVYWTDFATKERGSIYDLLCKMWDCSFKEALNRVKDDFSTNARREIMGRNTNSISMNVSDSTEISKLYLYKNTELFVKIRDWKDYDIEYWNSYGVPLSFLKYANVYPISHKIIIADGRQYVLGADKYAYAFVEKKEGKTTIKIYQPYNKQGYKWSNKHDKSVISLWTKIPKEGDKLVICSSLKDALCLWANTGIPAVATQGEGYSMSKTAVNELKKRFKNIFILFDNDDPGIKDGQKLARETGFINLVLPKFEGGKDVSDFYKLHTEQFTELINNLVQNNKELETSDLPF